MRAMLLLADRSNPDRSKGVRMRRQHTIFQERKCILRMCRLTDAVLSARFAVPPSHDASCTGLHVPHASSWRLQQTIIRDLVPHVSLPVAGLASQLQSTKPRCTEPNTLRWFRRRPGLALPLEAAGG